MNLHFSGRSKILVTGLASTLLHSLPLDAHTVGISSKVMKAGFFPVRDLSNVTLIGVAYFMVLFGIGYAINRHFNLRKSKEEDPE